MQPQVVSDAIISSIKRRSFARKQTGFQKTILFVMVSILFVSAYLFQGLIFAAVISIVVACFIRWVHLKFVGLRESVMFSFASFVTSFILLIAKIYFFFYKNFLKNIKKIEFFPEFPYHKQTITKSMTKNEISLRDGFWGPKIIKLSPSPNTLTIIRFFGAICLLFFLNMGQLVFFSFVIILYLTDYFDGIIARTQDKITRFGIWADPIADRVLLAVFSVFVYFQNPPFWSSNISKILIPEIVLISSFVLIFLLKRTIQMQAIVVWGRMKCALYFFAMFSLLLGSEFFANLFINIGVIFATLSIPSYLACYYTRNNKRSVFHGLLSWFARNSKRIRFELTEKGYQLE